MFRSIVRRCGSLPGGSVNVAHAIEAATSPVASMFRKLLARVNDHPYMLTQFEPLDQWDRSLMHFIVAAGSYKVVRILTNFLKESAKDASMQSHGGFLKRVLRETLRTEDVVGFTPFASAVRVFYYAPDDATNARFSQTDPSRSSESVLPIIGALRDLCAAAGVEECDYAAPNELIDDYARRRGSTAAEIVEMQERPDVVAARKAPGGWDPTPLTGPGDLSLAKESPLGETHAGIDRCDIAEVSVFDPNFNGDVLMDDYVRVGRPVMLRGFALNTTIRETFTKESLIHRHGNTSATKGAIPYAVTFGVKSHDTTIGRMANEEYTQEGGGSTHHKFQFQNYTFITPELVGGTTQLRGDAPLPPMLEEFQKEYNVKPLVTQFYVGKQSRGRLGHQHNRNLS